MNGESLDGFGDKKVISHIPIRDKNVGIWGHSAPHSSVCDNPYNQTAK